MKITLLKTDAEPEVIYEGEYREVPLKELYDLIGCEVVERLPLPTDEEEIWIDEEGKLPNEWKVNARATILFVKAFIGQDTDPDYDWKVAGNAVLIERSPEEVEKYNAE